MTVRLSDQDIIDLINEAKPLPETYLVSLKLKPRRGHKKAGLDIDGVDGSKFRIILRQSNEDQFDFSVILGYYLPGTNVLFRLRRYNSRSHEHTNKIEKDKFFEYHIHKATERYQLSGLDEDEYAETTDGYSDLHDALQCLINECNFILPETPQIALF